jgi:hypothetical protein
LHDFWPETAVFCAQEKTPAPNAGTRSQHWARTSDLFNISKYHFLKTTMTSSSFHQSMIQVLRELALARVQTAIPGFGLADLDRWIMSTGYEGAAAPHACTGDLLYVYAASITNTGGAKPKPEVYGALIRDAMRPYVENGVLCHIPSRRQLAQACAPHLDQHRLADGFSEDIRQMALGHDGRPLMSGLLSSVIAFASWLLEHYAGDARVLHHCLRQGEGAGQAGSGLDLLRQLDQLPWVGIAVAANFLKDSQVPGLRVAGFTAAATSNCLVGWFAKPDLHVTRLMGYVTGRLQQPQGDPRQLTLGQAMAQYHRSPHRDFQSRYPALLAQDRNDMKVILDIHAWALAAGTSALEIDRILFLIGVQSTLVNGMTVNAKWYPTFVASVDSAVARGISRKS